MKIATLGDSMQSLLDLFVEYLPTFNVEVPDSRYVGAGQIPWDGESLTIYLSNITAGQPGAPFGLPMQVASMLSFSATLYVQIIREISNVGTSGGSFGLMLPDTSSMGADGLAAMNDAQGLVRTAVDIFANYYATDPGEGFKIGDVSPLGPEGGLAAMRLALDISLT